MLQGLSSRLILALAAFVAFLPVPFAAGAQLNSAARGNPAAGARRVSQADSALAAHVLSRLTFGPRPGDIGRLLQTGIDRWIDGQLRPESIVDSSGARALEGCSAWTDPVEGVVASLSGSISVGTMMRPSDGRMVRTSVSIIGVPSLIMRDSARRNERTGPALLEMGQLIACRLARVEASDQQLVEVLTDFWANHFSINSARVPSRGALVEWDRAVIRPRALGRFRDLLGAVARSPAMLAYLDNAVSSADSSHPTLEEVVQARAVGAAPVVGARRGGLNENYARELLELHTLGVDGGYTQTDVIEVARALTGWTHSLAPTNREQRFLAARPGVPAVFRFDSAAHDAGAKHVLGHALPAGRGIEDGDEVLDILARHTSTARFVARKLAVRLVSDAPPEALVERAAATFARTDGDIREVVRTIVTSPEFLSPDVYRAKVKSPLELVLSIRRALAAPPDTRRRRSISSSRSISHLSGIRRQMGGRRLDHRG